ncbi:MAG: 4Fe-4S dicluster domain-containing protein [Sedimentisphaerales bacterium]
MEAVFISELKPFLDAVAEQMDLYVPKKIGQGPRLARRQHYVFSKYDPSAEAAVEFNNIRACMPVKEFLFPLRELTAVFPEPFEPQAIKPFAVFGLKDCDLRSLECLDQVFLEKDFEDPFYIARRQKMFIISSDCFEPGESCFCNALDGKGTPAAKNGGWEPKPYPERGFDLNVAQITEGYVIEIGSKKGKEFVEGHDELFAEPSDESIAERDRIRDETAKQLEQNNAELKFDAPIRDMMTATYDTDVYDEEATTCVECQACTRVCPTCHCFYLYDTKQKDYFTKMKMWDSCMRMAYAQVAGGANPRKMLGDRLRHRLMHKFVYFLDRYGLQMCIGCGRCVDAEAGNIDIRAVLKKLNEELKGKKKLSHR